MKLEHIEHIVPTDEDYNKVVDRVNEIEQEVSNIGYFIIGITAVLIIVIVRLI